MSDWYLTWMCKVLSPPGRASRNCGKGLSGSTCQRSRTWSALALVSPGMHHKLLCPPLLSVAENIYFKIPPDLSFSFLSIPNKTKQKSPGWKKNKQNKLIKKVFPFSCSKDVFFVFTYGVKDFVDYCVPEAEDTKTEYQREHWHKHQAEGLGLQGSHFDNLFDLPFPDSRLTGVRIEELQRFLKKLSVITFYAFSY